MNGFCDESEDPSVFVLAGYVAPAEEWSQFSDEWHSTLNASPNVRELKTKDAMSLNGAFRGFSEGERDKKLCDLYDVIDKYVSFEVSSVIPLEPYKRIFKDGVLPKKAGQPYYDAFFLLVSGVAKQQIKDGMEEKIDFVFDERVIEQGKILEVWDQCVKDSPAEVKHLLGTPIFRKDKDVLPLQAADLEAWWLRRRWQEKLTGIPRLEYPWRPAAIPSVTMVFTEEQMRQSYEMVLRGHLDLGWRPKRKK